MVVKNTTIVVYALIIIESASKIRNLAKIMQRSINGSHRSLITKYIKQLPTHICWHSPIYNGESNFE
jgi:hypothetical protein